MEQNKVYLLAQWHSEPDDASTSWHDALLASPDRSVLVARRSAMYVDDGYPVLAALTPDEHDAYWRSERSPAELSPSLRAAELEWVENGTPIFEYTITEVELVV